MAFAFAEPVVLHTYSAGDPDALGNDMPVWTDTDLCCFSVVPTTSSEATNAQDVITRGYTLIAIGYVSVTITGLDEITCRGERCPVLGDPDIFHSPWSGTEVTEVQLLRRT